MDALADQRFVAFGGPARDWVVLVVDAPDEATIRAQLALDPWTPGLLRTVAVQPWTIWLGSDDALQAATAPLYLVGYKPGPGWDYAKPRREQRGWDDHAEFMDMLVSGHVVILGGPLDGQRALVVAQHRDQLRLRSQLEDDPWNDDVLAIDYIERWELWLAARRASTRARQPVLTRISPRSP
jgi:hypothetical protein